MSPADDALVVLFEAAVSSSYLITFAQFVLRAAVALAARVEGFDVFGLEILIRISVVVPAKEHVIAASWKSQTRNQHFTSIVPSEWMRDTLPL